MQRTGSPWMIIDPCHGVPSRSQTVTDVKLQDDVLVRVLGKDLHRHFTVDGLPLGHVIVVPGTQSGPVHRLVSLVERIGHLLPVIESSCFSGARENYVARAEYFV